MAATKRLAKERLSIERDPIPYITLVDDDGDGSNILQWKIVLELSPVHDSLDDPAVIGRASESPYCNPPTETPTKEKSKGILAGVARAAKASASKSSSDAAFAGPISRPAGSAYFAFKFEFPANYPFKPPLVTVLSNSYHPNIKTSTGEICDSMLTGEGWGPTLNVKKVCAQLRKFLCDPDPDHPLESQIAQTLVDKPNEYAKTAYRHAGDHCTREKAMKAIVNMTK
jgi:ubiquitin-protein ligase